LLDRRKALVLGNDQAEDLLKGALPLLSQKGKNELSTDHLPMAPQRRKRFVDIVERVGMAKDESSHCGGIGFPNMNPETPNNVFKTLDKSAFLRAHGSRTTALSPDIEVTPTDSDVIKSRWASRRRQGCTGRGELRPLAERRVPQAMALAI